ncbi:BON domain-containing protein [Phenylobacterium sp.]|uniref:BON domain-containing protein n=1 Tax=Phenylobacterium sp. TaxID=1871053 RepID=UPI00272F1DF8|nr:BON domain-containing protein [Phenylobacterium sp.]MDP1988977.1 BON domain-containing protein [Phenylobacterium sp.]
MANRWMEDQDRQRASWPRDDGYGDRSAARGDRGRFEGGGREERSFAGGRDDRGPVFGERETGADYEHETSSRSSRSRAEQSSGQYDDRDRIYGEGYFGPEGYAMEQGGFGGDAIPDAPRGRRASTRQAYARAYGGDGRPARESHDRGFWDRTTDEVASWFGDEEAERRRRQDEARSNRGRGPKGYVRPDERILDDAHHHLTDDPWLDASDIEVMVRDGELTLSGTVDDRRAKHHAERCVEDIHGVKHVQNNLRVQPRVDQPSIVTGQPGRMATNSTLAKVTNGEE